MHGQEVEELLDKRDGEEMSRTVEMHASPREPRCISNRSSREGNCLLLSPEGERTLTGEMGPFFRGAYQLADELQLPVVPITLDGPYEVLSRNRGPINFVFWHRLRMTIHKPIPPIGKGPENIKNAMELSREAIASALPK